MKSSANQIDMSQDQNEVYEKIPETIEETHAAMVQFLAKPGSDILDSLTPAKCNLMHAAIGIASEGGEILDCVKKYIIYNKDLDRDNLIEELGDMEFFMQQC